MGKVISPKDIRSRGWKK